MKSDPVGLAKQIGALAVTGGFEYILLDHCICCGDPTSASFSGVETTLLVFFMGLDEGNVQ